MKQQHWTRRLASLVLILAILVGLLYQFGHKTYMKRTYPLQFSQYVETASDEYGVAQPLIYAIIKVESGFEPNAVSDVHAIGLMQMTEDTFDWLAYKKGDSDLTFAQLFNPDVSIDYGTYFLLILLQTYDWDYTTVIAAYHAGMGNVDSWLQDSAYSDDGVTLKAIPDSAKDTAHYVAKVTHAEEIYEEKLTE